MGYRAFRRVAAGLAIAWAAQGCARWQVETAPLPELLASARPEALRVTGDSSRVVLFQPMLVADSLVGSRIPRADRTAFATTEAVPEDSSRIRVALSDVRRVESRHVATGRTLLLALGVTAALSLAALIAIATTLQGGLLGS